MEFITGNLYYNSVAIFLGNKPGSFPEDMVGLSPRQTLLYLGDSGGVFSGGYPEKKFLWLEENKIVYDCETTARRTWMFTVIDLEKAESEDAKCGIRCW